MSGLTVDLDDTLTTKADRLFALCAANGDMDGGTSGGHGLYLNDTRFLRSWTLRIGGRPAVALAASADRDRSVSVLTNPPLDLDEGIRLPERSLIIRRERVLAAGAVETLRIRSVARSPVRLTVELELDSEFEDLFVVRGVPMGRRGVLAPPAWSGSELRLRYDGADGRTRWTSVSFEPAPTAVAGARATYALVLPAGGETSIRVAVTLREEGDPDPAGPGAVAFADCAVETDNPLFDGALQRSLDDLRMLVTTQDGARFAAAGVPWYVALFGRDSLITSFQALAYDHRLAADTLRALARHQGRVHAVERGEEPGKILHEVRVGEMTRLGELPFAPSFATVDATPLFVCLLAEQVRWSGDLSLWRSLRGAVERALEWIERWGDHDGDGFLDYDGRAGGGLYNQGWKDSGNAIVNADGTMPVPPIALVEVQAYAYRARLDAAWLLRTDGDAAEAARLEAAAADLRDRFLRAFWLPDRGGRLAMALQAGGRPVDVLASNAGHALWAGIVDAGRAATVARTLLGDALFSGWGVRTLAASEVAYNPLDYQLGAIWPHDSAIVAAGLKRYGHVEGSLAILSGLFDAAVRFPLQRLPELFAGLSRREFPEPVRWPAACSPQAWAAGTLPYLLQTALGLEPDATRERLVVRRPALPSWLGRVVWRGVRVGAGAADLRFTRGDGGTARVEVLDRLGPLTVAVEE